MNRILHYSQPGSQAIVDPKVARTAVVLAIPLASQRNHLVEYLIKTRSDKDVSCIHNELNRMLHYSQPASQAKADKKVAATLGMLGICLSSQHDYLTEYLHLHPKTKSVNVIIIASPIHREEVTCRWERMGIFRQC